MNEHPPRTSRTARRRPTAAGRQAAGTRRPRLSLVLAVVLGSFALLAIAPIAGAIAAGTIQGTVSGAGAPQTGVEVDVLDIPAGEFIASATTDVTGEYHVAGLAPGTYKVQFVPPSESEFVGQYFKAKATLASAEPVTVNEGSTTTAINAELAKGGKISGLVKAEGVALENAEVVVLPVDIEQSFFGLATTKAGGAYTIVGVPPGEYTVYFSAPPGENLIPQLWDDEESFSGATHVTVSGEAEVPNIGADLGVGGQISGTVTDAATHQPLANVFVIAMNSRGVEFLGSDAETDPDGHYSIPGLATGSYSLEFFAEGATEYLALKTGLVGVTQPNTTAGLNVSLTRAAPVNTAAPMISGTPAIGGSSLSCATGSWTGRATLKYTYQWTRDGAAIAGAIANSYVAQAADQGHGLACQVTAANAVGHATATSNTLAVPAPVASIETQPPLAVPVAKTLASRLIVSGATARVRVSCGAARCVGTLQVLQQVVTRTHKGRRTIVHRRTVTLASGAYSLAGGHSATVTLRLTAAGKRRLALARGHRLLATLVLSVKGGRTTRHAVLVKKAAARRKR
jgi:hypothetical protein